MAIIQSTQLVDSTIIHSGIIRTHNEHMGNQTSTDYLIDNGNRNTIILGDDDEAVHANNTMSSKSCGLVMLPINKFLDGVCWDTRHSVYTRVGSPSIVSIGLVVVALLTLPLSLYDLDANILVQKVSFITTMSIIFIFWILATTLIRLNTNDVHHIVDPLLPSSELIATHQGECSSSHGSPSCDCAASTVATLSRWYSFQQKENICTDQSDSSHWPESHISAWPHRNVTELLGACIFNFNYVFFLPTWANERRPAVGINWGVWSSAIVSIFTFIAIGVWGALTYVFNGKYNDMLMHLATDNKTYGIGPVTSIVFPLIVNLSGIPVTSILIRYNLEEYNAFSKTFNAFVAHILPWILVIPFNTQAGVEVWCCSHSLDNFGY